MTTIAEALEAARQRHVAGAWDAAEEILRRLVQSVPECGAAWLRLGTIAMQRGQTAAAVEAFTQAAAREPLNAAAQCNLGVALGAQGRLVEAVVRFRQALACQPAYPEAHLNLGATLQQQGDLAAAAGHFARAVQLRPHYAQAHHHWGAVLKLQGRLDAALACFRRAAECNPQYPEAFYGLGVVLRQQGQPEAAVAHFQRAIALRPDYADAHNNLGTTFQELHRLPEAAACFRRVLELRPEDATAHNNLGAVSWCLGQPAAAIACFRQAVALRPDYAEAYNNWGLAAEDQGQTAEAAQVLDRAVQIAPEFAEAHMHRAMLWLLHGDFARGWREYEWRFRMPAFAPPVTTCPMWDGTPLAGRTLLIYSEGGLGDTIQFVRYAALARRSGGPVILSCPPALQPLLATCPHLSQVIADSDPPPPSDVFAPLLSLPRILGTTLADVPAEIPYLTASPALVASWRERLATSAGRRIGIVWKGNCKQTENACRHRSAPLAAMAPLAAVPGIRLISLQKGDGCAQLAALGARFPVETLPGLDETAGPFLDTAAVMMNLELVVTVDTAIGHLAGALGVPVWLALSFAPECRWLRDREDTPWYPTMRLFRQRTPGDWEDVFRRMAASVGGVLRNPPVAGLQRMPRPGSDEPHPARRIL